jgi:diguanylate cyclase (GGDEF)-like protein/PAS domain S-box-containing protein
MTIDAAAETILLQARLVEAEETLRAIREGEIDALVVQGGSAGAELFTLSSADRPYRMFVENMRDGAATVSPSGIVVYANRRLGELLARDLTELIGSPIASLVADSDRAALRAISGRAGPGGTLEVDLLDSAERRIPVRVNTWTLDVEFEELLCLTFADLTQQNTQKREIQRLSHAQATRMRELEYAQDELSRQATHDSLTGLPNRTLLIDRVTQSLARARRSGLFTGLIFLDLDGFKQINDTRGHAAGDAVLRKVGDRLAGLVRPMDTISRLGGDEFVVLLPEMAALLDGVAVAARITEALTAPIELDHAVVSVTASIGISVLDPTLPEAEYTPERLLAQADAAMYHAKSRGSSNAELFDENTPLAITAKSDATLAMIREALDEQRLVLYAQPIVELATGRILQEELLLRMVDRDGNVIPPLVFLPTAERCGLITEIDRWVITEATRHAAGGRPLAVNLSAASVVDNGLLRLIERQLREHRTDPRDLVFEITETAVMQNIDQSRLFAKAMVGLGCQFALDDFGTGFASFTYLKLLPVQYLKIDIEFVRDLTSSAQDKSVVRAIVALAHDFGQRTIAEGVEDEPTAEVLRDLGVDLAQGYLFGRPHPVSDDIGPSSGGDCLGEVPLVS